MSPSVRVVERERMVNQPYVGTGNFLGFLVFYFFVFFVFCFFEIIQCDNGSSSATLQ